MSKVISSERAVTEEQAKTKLCPVAKLMDRQAGFDKGCCLGSGCAVWMEIGVRISEGPAGSVMEERGYCGLVGKPRREDVA